MYDAFVANCQHRYTSPNAPNVRDVLGILVLSILAGHKRYAHIATIRSDQINPELLAMENVVSEDSADGHCRSSTKPKLLPGWMVT